MVFRAYQRPEPVPFYFSSIPIAEATTSIS